MWDEIANPFPNFNDATVAVWEWIIDFIPHFTRHIIIDNILTYARRLISPEGPVTSLSKPNSRLIDWCNNPEYPSRYWMTQVNLNTCLPQTQANVFYANAICHIAYGHEMLIRHTEINANLDIFKCKKWYFHGLTNDNNTKIWILTHYSIASHDIWLIFPVR